MKSFGGVNRSFEPRMNQFLKDVSYWIVHAMTKFEVACVVVTFSVLHSFFSLLWYGLIFCRGILVLIVDNSTFFVQA